MRPLIGQEPGPGGEHPILPSDRDRGQRLALVGVGVKLVETAARLLFQHHRGPLAHIDRGIDPGLQGHACGEVKGSGVVDGDPIVDAIEREGLAEASLGDPGGAADGPCVALTRGIDDGRAARFLEVVGPDELGVVPTAASPTSATRAKKASNLLILRSWGRKGRHYKVMLWLGHEAGVGGDLGG